jgi:hypothetical protein
MEILVHPYGSSNIYEQKNLFNTNIMKLRWILQQYRNWLTTGERDVIVTRYLSLLRVRKIYLFLCDTNHFQGSNATRFSVK